MGVAVYGGSFGVPQAERLLWRAGFGPRRGEAQALAKLGLHGAVQKLAHPGPERLVGRPPRDEKGRPLAPADAWGHDHCWWLDRMVRTSRPLTERMTLIWHDWFATSNAGVGDQRLMLAQNQLFRSHALGSFRQLLLDVTKDPAMLLWLNGTDNVRSSPNENYAREMMELFTLGADRGAYTENDVREQARALTGWQNRWKAGLGDYDFHYDRREHDPGRKTVFHHSGTYDWHDACNLCIQNPKHASFFVQKLWSYFVPAPPDAATARALEAIYRNGYEVGPVVEAILKHPALYVGPRMVKPPIVFTAGLLRRIGESIHTTAWAWIGELTGQRLFYPPNVAGWDDTRWLDTASFRGRWIAVQEMVSGIRLNSSKPPKGEPTDAAGVLKKAIAFWHEPELSDATQRALASVAEAAFADASGTKWKQQQYPVLLENALRLLVAISPDVQTS